MSAQNVAAQTLAARTHIAETGKRLFDRALLDLAGGNLSVRVGDEVCITPRYSGPTYHWNLTPDDVMVITLDEQILFGNGQLSRESKVHLRLHRDYRAYGEAIVHAHARSLLVFAAMARPIPPVLEGTRRFGEIKVTTYAPSHTDELADYISAGIKGQEARIEAHAAAVLAPYHGIFCMGRDLDLAADAVERIETNAYCLLMGAQIGASPAFTDERAIMEAEKSKFIHPKEA
ncbi:MAG: class II aldolase/adducin family protein [Anaerolineae bacterium]